MPFLYPVRQPVIKLLIILSYVMPSKYGRIFKSSPIYTKEFELIPFKSRRRYPLYFKVGWKNSFAILGGALCMANGMTADGCYKLNANKNVVIFIA